MYYNNSFPQPVRKNMHKKVVGVRSDFQNYLSTPEGAYPANSNFKWVPYKVGVQDGVINGYIFQLHCFVQLGPVYTMDHEVGPWKMAFFHGPTSMVWFLKKSIYKAFVSLTRCKPNVDQVEWPCARSECADFFHICPKIKDDHSFVFSCLCLLFPIKHFNKKNL